MRCYFMMCCLEYTNSSSLDERLCSEDAYRVVIRSSVAVDGETKTAIDGHLVGLGGLATLVLFTQSVNIVASSALKDIA